MKCLVFEQLYTKDHRNYVHKLRSCEIKSWKYILNILTGAFDFTGYAGFHVHSPVRYRFASRVLKNAGTFSEQPLVIKPTLNPNLLPTELSGQMGAGQFVTSFSSLRDALW